MSSTTSNNPSTTSDKEGIKSSLKTTGLFGGVQIFKIAISIISNKFVAVLLGPAGMGIMGLLNQTTVIISQVSGLGLGSSAVRDVSSSYSKNNEYLFNRTISVFRKLVWFTGLIGCFFCLFFSPLLSKLSFGNYDYTLAFAILSITLLFSQISSGQNVVLTGTKRFKDLALSGLLGSSIGLLFSVPIYYILGKDGIVIVMVIQSITSLLLSFYFSRKVKTKKVHLTWKETFQDGKVMLKMGFFIAMQGFWGMLFSYIVRLYISNNGGLDDVGLYSSGFNIISAYVGLVFTAMATEYYPRLSTNADNANDFSNCINQQMKIALLLVSPMIAIFIAFSDIGIKLLFSEKFISITNMVMIGIYGIFLKAPGWCMGFAFLAKGDSKAFFYNELSIQIIMAAANICFYHFFGLTGLGVSYVLSYIIYDIQCLIICKKRYGYILDTKNLISIIPQLLISGVILVVGLCLSSVFKYSIGACLSVVSGFLFYKEILKIIDIKSYIINKIKRR